MALKRIKAELYILVVAKESLIHNLPVFIYKKILYFYVTSSQCIRASMYEKNIIVSPANSELLVAVSAKENSTSKTKPKSTL